MMIKNILAVGLGGAIGAILRYILTILMQRFSLLSVSLSIILVNLIGCFGLGLFYSYTQNANVDEKLSLFISVGIFGALTTFSTFSKEVFELVENNKLLPALLYIIISVIFGIVMFYVGKILFERLISS